LAGFRGTLLVVGRRLRVRDEIRHRLHAVGQSRQLAEELRQHGIDALAEVAIARQQLVGCAVIELRVGP
jgi:hypothetical protein